jgi:NADH dehydrogenase/NADH:ubiquinone oxidoreductase subunit G
MVTITIDGLQANVEEGMTVLEAARFMGFSIPTLCHHEGLSPYGACRLCVVEIGEGPRSKLVSSCTYPVEQGLKVKTASKRVVRARRMMIELFLGTCPQSKVVQDLASAYGVSTQRFKQEHEDCLLCGLCVRMCSEQMAAGAIGFRGRGEGRSIGTPFDMHSETCRLCGACMYICPACQLRCTFDQPENAVCNACVDLTRKRALEDGYGDTIRCPGDARDVDE